MKTYFICQWDGNEKKEIGHMESQTHTENEYGTVCANTERLHHFWYSVGWAKFVGKFAFLESFGEFYALEP